MAPAFQTEKCRSEQCQAPIIWARTTSGRSMPVNADPTPDGNIAVEVRQGMIMAIVYPEPIRDGRTSHFMTCPAAHAWRKRK